MLLPKKLNHFLFFILCGCFFLQKNVSAVQVPKTHKPVFLQSWHLVSTVSGGMAFAQVGDSHTLTQANDFTRYQYYARHSYSGRASWGVFAGGETSLPRQWLVQVGVGFYNPNTFLGNGVLYQGIDPQSTDAFNYSYKLKSNQLLVESKLLKALNNFYKPYVSLALGVSNNKASNYEVYIPSFLTFSPQFHPNKTAQFTYKIGLGMEMDAQKNWRLGLGYRFSGLGKADLGLGMLDGLPFPQTLRQSQLHAHEVLLQLSYLII